MTCCDEGRLMAYLDGQLSPGESRTLSDHLQACSNCRGVLERLAGERDEAAQLLDRYQRATGQVPVPKPRSWTQPNGRINSRKGAVKRMRRYFQWIAAAAVVMVIFSFDPARSLAAQFLSVFRVDKVQVLHFDPADLRKLEEALRNHHQVSIRNFGDFESEPLTDPAFIRQEEMPQEFGDYIRQYASVQRGEVVKISPDVEGINQFLRSLGSTTLMPPELAGKAFKITLPDVSHTNYQNRQTGTHINITRVAAPAMEIPAGVPVLAVRQALLDLPILPHGLKRALEGVDDWTRTLPFPAYGGQTEEITLGNARGLFIQGRVYPGNQDETGSGDVLDNVYYGPSVIAWNRNGIWTVLEGWAEMTREEAFDLARELEVALNGH